MAQSGNRPPRRGQSAKTGSGPPQAAPAVPATGGPRLAPAGTRLPSGRASASRSATSAARRTRPRRKGRGPLPPPSRGARPRPPRRNEPGPEVPRSAADAQGRSKATLAAVFGSVVVLVVVLVIVLVSVTGNKAPTKPTGFGLKAAPASVVSAISSVPLSSFNAAGSTATSSGPYPGAITPLKRPARAETRRQAAGHLRRLELVPLLRRVPVAARSRPCALWDLQEPQDHKVRRGDR